MFYERTRVAVSIVMIAYSATACSALSKLGIGKKGTTDTKIASVPVTNPKSVQVFNDNKENLETSRKFLQDFSGMPDAMAQREAAGGAADYIKVGEATLKNLTSGIVEGIDEFQANYAEAKSFKLKSNMGWLETAITKAKDALSGVRTTLLKDVESGVEWFSMPAANAQNAAQSINDINGYYALLEKIWPDDAEIKAHKEKNLPVAQKGYDKIMKQVGKNKMPKSAYAGADKAAIEESIVVAYKERYASDEVLRVVITSAKWQEKTEVADDNVKLQIKSYLYISAHVAVKRKDVATVFVLSFRKPKAGGKLELGGVGNSYPVAMKNLGK